MKQKLSFVFLLISLLFSFFLAGCKSKDTVNNPTTDRCHHRHTATKIYTKASLLGALPYTYLDGSKRTYVLDYFADSICTDVHINVRYQTTMMRTSGPIFSFQCVTSWSVLWEASDSGVTQYPDSTIFWNGETEDIGLKQTFGENPGELFGNLYISFPTRGTQQLDSIFFLNHFVDAEISISFTYHNYNNETSNLINHGLYKDLVFTNESRKNLFRGCNKIAEYKNKSIKLPKITIKPYASMGQL